MAIKSDSSEVMSAQNDSYYEELAGEEEIHLEETEELRQS
jgi:hypothetical protein